MPSLYQALSDLNANMEETYQEWLEDRLEDEEEEVRSAFLDGENWRRGFWFEYTDHSDYWQDFPVKYFDEVYDLASEGDDALPAGRWSTESVFCAYFLDQIDQEKIENLVRDKIRQDAKRVVESIHPWTVSGKPHTHLTDEAIHNILSFV